MALELSSEDGARFWSKAAQDGAGCWIWMASKNWRGVGFFYASGKRNLSAPRVAWELRHGPIPEGAHVLHTCDNPSCVNPRHLFLGDHASNMRDKSAKGRARRGYEHRPRLTDKEVAEAAALRQVRGWSWASLGRRYELPYQTVRRRVLKLEASRGQN